MAQIDVESSSRGMLWLVVCRRVWNKVVGCKGFLEH